MGKHWTPNRIETDVSLNIPDLWFRFGAEFTGWMELKQIHAWERDKTRITRVPNLTLGQKIWLRDNHAAGANTWLLLWIQRSGDYLFVPGNKVALIGDIPQEDTEARGFRYRGLPHPATIKQMLKGRGEII